MIYNTSIEHQKKQAITRFEYLLNKSKVIELKEKQPPKTSNQHRYKHLLFGAYAIETGLPYEYVKQYIYKQIVNPEIFRTEVVNKITGEVVIAWRSVTTLDKAESSLSIDRFITHAKMDLGILLPDPNDLVALYEIERQIEINKEYL